MKTTLLVRNADGTEGASPFLNIHGADLLEYTRKMPLNPFTGTSWKSADLATVQVGVKNDVTGSGAVVEFSDLVRSCEF